MKALESKPTNNDPFEQTGNSSIDNAMPDDLSVDTTMLLEEYSPPRFVSKPSPPQQAANEFIADPNASVQSERQRFQEYLCKQLELLTGIRKQLLRDEHDDLDVEKLNKFQFWKKILLKERQACAEQIAELKLEVRELRTILDEIQDQIYLVFQLHDHSSFRFQQSQLIV